MLFSLSGKNILITGATSGIGRATAVMCAKQGARVLCIGRNEERMCSLLTELHSISSAEHSSYLLDLTNNQSLVDCVRELPPLDGLVLAAGINKWKPIPFIKLEEIHELININTIAAISLLKEICKKKKLKECSSVVFVSSIAGVYTTSMGNAMYAVSKGGLQAFMKTAALELSSKGIRCNSVNPGRIETDLIKNNTQLSDEEIRMDINRYPLKRYGTPLDVAYSIVFLLSDETSWITGTDIVVDGGLTLK